MTEHHRDQPRPRIRITDKRRVSADPDPDRADGASPVADEPLRSSPEVGEPLGSPSVARGAPSGDPRGSSEAPEMPETRGSSKETPLVTGEDPSVVGEERAAEGGPEEAEGKAAEYLEDLRRLKAEFENYRKRVGKEQTRAIDLAAAPVMAKLLEVLDEFELALMAADRSPDFDRFVRGVEMVYAKLTDVLRSEGLEPIEAEGKPFDPARHEALLQADGEGDPYVADVLRPGYTLKGRVLRPAGVKVARR
jgi:molecular chaperone GrpE